MTFQHIKFIAVTALLTLAVSFVQSCKHSKDEPDPPQKEADLTVLVYMAANTNLGQYDFDEKDLDEIRAAVSAGALQGNRLLVYRKPYMGTATLTEFTADGSEKQLCVYTDNTVTSVHASRMTEVLDDARKEAPSRRFGLMLWGHATGWLQNGLEETVSARSWGNEQGRCMNITTLARVLRPVHPDWVYFDCCYMATVEVAYQLRDATDNIVGSVTEIRSNGTPYDLALPLLMRPGSSDLVGAADATYRYYAGQSTPTDRSCAMSVIDVRHMDALATAAKKIHDNCKSRVPDDYVGQPFNLDGTGYYYDLDHYMQALVRQNPAAQPFLDAWNRALADAVVYKANTEEAWFLDRNQWAALPLEHHCGLSTLLMVPGAENLKNYSQLDWPYAAGLLPN